MYRKLSQQSTVEQEVPTGMWLVPERAAGLSGSVCWLPYSGTCPARQRRPFLCGVQQWQLCSLRPLSHDYSLPASFPAPSGLSKPCNCSTLFLYSCSAQATRHCSLAIEHLKEALNVTLGACAFLKALQTVTSYCRSAAFR